jgi:hypothetical protein
MLIYYYTIIIYYIGDSHSMTFISYKCNVFIIDELRCWSKRHIIIK